jgi:uncharacterized protein (UPF0332 family)
VSGKPGGLLDKAGENVAASRHLLHGGYTDVAASRAYYAAFYAAEALLLSLDQSYSKHRGVIGAYGREFAKTGRLDPKYHALLRDLFDERQTADYAVESGLSPADVGMRIEQVAEFVAAARGLLEGRSEAARSPRK